MLTADETSLTFSQDHHILRVEPWGPHAFRIRATVNSLPFPSQDWALTESIEESKPQIGCPPSSSQPTLPPPQSQSATPRPICNPATISHGNIKATITALGHLSIHTQDGKPILLEKNRTRIDPLSPSASALEIPARDFKPIPGTSNFSLSFRLESLSPTEHIYGGGQYQQPILDLKGVDLELAQRNSQASVPFFLSSLNYGILWNNPAVGRVVFAKNGTTFEAASTELLDIWIVAPPSNQNSSQSTTLSSGTPSNSTSKSNTDDSCLQKILTFYANVTGHSPKIPSYALGFWQSKLRYRTQSELLSVAHEFRRLSLPISVLVLDFFHWPVQGSWQFDPQFFPDPASMISELKSLNIQLLISIWPTVDHNSPLYAEMHEQSLLVRVGSGNRITMDFMGNTVHADFTNPATRKYVWNVVAKNYADLGVEMFWLDEAEPEYTSYDFGLYRYHEGSVMEVGNVFSVRYAQAFYEGQRKRQERVCNLVRCAWAGSQKFGAVVWSGDIASSWSSFRNQLCAGLNIGMAGIPWWTTDIGGFHGGKTEDPGFRELLVRWFQWGTFCPIMRLHGCREPSLPQLGEGGGSKCVSGSGNEPWSFGEENLGILRRHMLFRERIRGYLEGLFEEAEKGVPIMRAMFLEFPDDRICWEEEEQYMFGRRYLVAPILEEGMKVRRVYLPGGKWKQLFIGEERDKFGEMIDGGKDVEVDLSMNDMPVFVRQ